jgi:thiol-disulfide isomerase/thioredoxin
MTSVIVRAAVPVALALVLAGCSSAATSTESTPPPPSSSSAPPSADAAGSSASPVESAAAESPAAVAEGPGTYITLAEYAGNEAMYGDVVLFFHADWCPTCQGTEKDLTENAAAIPAGLTIVKVDYDTETDLRQKYGVTTQHTFVHVDETGTELAKWNGSMTGADIAAAIA